MNKLLLLFLIQFNIGLTASEPSKWYEGGTLHKSNGHEWIKATEANRLATSADFSANMLLNLNVPFIVESDEFKEVSKRVKTVIDNIYAIESSRQRQASELAMNYFLQLYK